MGTSDITWLYFLFRLNLERYLTSQKFILKSFERANGLCRVENMRKRSMFLHPYWLLLEKEGGGGEEGEDEAGGNEEERKEEEE